MVIDWPARFEEVVDRKTREALAAMLPAAARPWKSERRQTSTRSAIAWTRRLFDGDFYLSRPPRDIPATGLVFVQSSDGNTGARNPASLGGGETDKHLIYEGLSRVAADGVLAGAETIRGSQVVFSVWRPELVALRAALRPAAPSDSDRRDARRTDIRRHAAPQRRGAAGHRDRHAGVGRADEERPRATAVDPNDCDGPTRRPCWRIPQAAVDGHRAHLGNRRPHDRARDDRRRADSGSVSHDVAAPRRRTAHAALSGPVNGHARSSRNAAAVRRRRGVRASALEVHQLKALPQRTRTRTEDTVQQSVMYKKDPCPPFARRDLRGSAFGYLGCVILISNSFGQSLPVTNRRSFFSS